MQMRQRDVAALDTKIHEGVSGKAKMMLCVMMPLWSSFYQSSLSVGACEKPPPPPAVCNFPTGRHPTEGLVFRPQRDHLCHN
ncbi:hypothetical protein CEXT_224251 [Caerostris extrusa]|uniref:Uncharacterized protein n=1 Tax=Caerostris extrusa TaxID=172846 RepID=A0AAV4P7W0_CAEEX|nr:hypothetical protein CEXT_224251 [Caerostris extrusa]